MKPTTASGIPVHCAHARLADVTTLVANPRNPNKHGDAQVALLAKIIRHQGWRAPITISKRSGFIVVGHGRLQAALLLQVEKVPVDEQDFATEADEWAHLVADNRIAELAETDGAMLKDLLIELDSATQDFDMDLSGFDAGELERVINSYHEQGVNDPNAEWQGMPAFEQDGILEGALTCIVRFKSEKERDEFEEFLGWKLSHKGKCYSTWFPKPEFDQLGKGLRYAEA